MLIRTGLEGLRKDPSSGDMLDRRHGFSADIYL